MHRVSFCAISPCFCCWELIFCLISGFCGYHLVEKNTAGTWITYNHVRKAINSNYTIYGVCALKVPKALVSSNAQTKCKLVFVFFLIFSCILMFVILFLLYSGRGPQLPTPFLIFTLSTTSCCSVPTYKMGRMTLPYKVIGKSHRKKNNMHELSWELH